MDPIELLEQLRRQAEASDNILLKRIIERYLAIVRRLDGRINALELFLETETENLEASQQVQSLLADVEQELSDFSAWLATELRAEVERSGLAGVAAGLALLSALTGSPAEQPGVNALDALAAYLRNDGPLMAKIRGMAEFSADRVRQIILEGVAVGKSPVKIGLLIREEGLGIGLTDALRWTRTLQNYSYRWANLASYEANGISAWIWWAELDERVCASCVALHGRVFPVSEGVANDHHNGRCAMIPFIEGVTVVNESAGAEWFESLSEAEQRAIMGNTKWEGWKAGKFEFSQLTTTYENDVFGTMRSEATLADLGIDG